MKFFPQNQVLLICIVFQNVLNHCQGVAADLPLFDTPTNASNVTHRSNFCVAHEDVSSGAIERRDALRGLNVTLGMLDYQIDGDTGGVKDDEIGVMFLDALASRAGFEYRNTFGVIEAPSNGNNYTWDELLFWGTDVYDLLGDYFVRNVNRLENRIDFSEPWYDGSLIMVMKKEKVNEFDMLTFVEPFTWQVWLLGGATVIVSGVVYYLTDYLESRRRSEKMEASLSTNIFHGLYAFTGHSNFQPRSVSTRIVTLSLCFTFLVLSSAYIANMASNFVTDYAPSVVVTTLTDAVHNELTICVWKSAASHSYLLEHYNSAKIAAYETGDKCAEALSKGECDVFLTYVSHWEILKRDVRYNGDCNLEWVGRTVERYESGFSSKDSKELCSKILTDVLTLHMLEMKVDGEFDEIWNDFYGNTQTINCETQSSDQGKKSLTLSKAGSLFIFHFASLAIAMIISVVRFYRMSKGKRSRILSELKRSRKQPKSLMLAASSANKMQLKKDDTFFKKKPTNDGMITDNEQIGTSRGSIQRSNLNQGVMSSDDEESDDDIALRNSNFSHAASACDKKGRDNVSEDEPDEKLSRMINLVQKVLKDLNEKKKMN